MKIKRFFSDSVYRFGVFEFRGLLNWMPDTLYLKLKYKAVYGKKLDFKNPRTFNEKLQWIKVFDRNPLYTEMVDKYKVKEYITERIGEDHVIPSYGVWDRFNDIPFDSLPDKFVLKCTHDSGGIVIVRDKGNFNFEQARSRIENSLNKNYYLWNREWPYKNVHPRIIAEEYIESINGLLDFRVYCINGSPFCIYVYKNSGEDTGKKPEVESCDIYDTEWTRMAFRQHYGPSKDGVKKPDELAQMLELSRKLSEGTLFLRCDFYILEGKLVVGELTLFPGGGFSKFIPAEYDEKIGALLHLEVKK